MSIFSFSTSPSLLLLSLTTQFPLCGINKVIFFILILKIFSILFLKSHMPAKNTTQNKIKYPSIYGFTVEKQS